MRKITTPRKTYSSWTRLLKTITSKSFPLWARRLGIVKCFLALNQLNALCNWKLKDNDLYIMYRLLNTWIQKIQSCKTFINKLRISLFSSSSTMARSKQFLGFWLGLTDETFLAKNLSFIYRLGVKSFLNKHFSNS